MKGIMNTCWEDLVMVNYEVDRLWLEQFVPAGCELELHEGKAIATVVAFRFRNTKILGLRMPFYRDFAEINLRIYVRRKVIGGRGGDGEADGGVGGAGGKRGVVFIKEIIPHRLPAWIANRVFRENFHVMPVRGMADDVEVKYRWGEGGEYVVKGEFDGGLVDWEGGGVEEFVGENYWAYKDRGVRREKGGMERRETLVFEVMHEAWRMRRLKNVEVEIDIGRLYGDEWAANMGKEPLGVFYVDGNEVEVTLPHVMGKREEKVKKKVKKKGGGLFR